MERKFGIAASLGALAAMIALSGSAHAAEAKRSTFGKLKDRKSRGS